MNRVMNRAFLFQLLSSAQEAWRRFEQKYNEASFAMKIFFVAMLLLVGVAMLGVFLQVVQLLPYTVMALLIVFFSKVLEFCRYALSMLFSALGVVVALPLLGVDVVASLKSWPEQISVPLLPDFLPHDAAAILAKYVAVGQASQHGDFVLMGISAFFFLTALVLFAKK